MADGQERFRFSVERYERMVGIGLLTKDERTELLDGQVYERPRGATAHAHAVTQAAVTLERHLADRAAVRVHGVVRLPPDAVPEPDVSLAVPGTGVEHVEIAGRRESVSAEAFPDVQLEADDLVDSLHAART